MAKQYKDNLESCLRSTLHHVAPHKARLMAAAGMVNEETVTMRNKQITAELTDALAQIARIREALVANNVQEALRLLNEEFEHGLELEK